MRRTPSRTRAWSDNRLSHQKLVLQPHFGRSVIQSSPLLGRVTPSVTTSVIARSVLCDKAISADVLSSCPSRRGRRDALRKKLTRIQSSSSGLASATEGSLCASGDSLLLPVAQNDNCGRCTRRLLKKLYTEFRLDDTGRHRWALRDSRRTKRPHDPLCPLCVIFWYLLNNLGNPAPVPVLGTPWPQIIEMILFLI
jgi:hypothetical protein